jgi:hypothetical protein
VHSLGVGRQVPLEVEAAAAAAAAVHDAVNADASDFWGCDSNSVRVGAPDDGNGSAAARRGKRSGSLRNAGLEALG